MHQQTQQITTAEDVEEPRMGARRREGCVGDAAPVDRTGAHASPPRAVGAVDTSKVFAHCSGETMSGIAWRYRRASIGHSRYRRWWVSIVGRSRSWDLPLSPWVPTG